jgi:DNA-binding transcriptional ArsR family regulator
MEPPLNAFRSEFHDSVQDLLWRQWTALGVSGHGSRWTRTPLDPEALILATCTLARRDPRLFDAMLDWMRINGQYVSVHRLQRLLAGGSFAGGAVFAAVAGTMSEADGALKWQRSSRGAPNRSAPSAEPLFFMPDGSPLMVIGEPDPRFLAFGFLRDRYEPRTAAGRFQPDVPANLLLRLRALLGVNARCEIIAYLLLNQRGSPRAVARACGYYPATVSKALAEMADSGFLASHVEGRHRYYSLVPDAWRSLSLGDARPPLWIAWPVLFAALERVWAFFEAPERADESSLAQASALRRILHDGVADGLGRGGPSAVLQGWERHAGESLLPYFVGELRALLDAVHRLG